MVNVKFKLRSNKVYKGHERPVKYSNQSDFHKQLTPNVESVACDEHRLNLKLTILNLFKFPSTTRSNDLTAKTQIKRKQPMN